MPSLFVSQLQLVVCRLQLAEKNFEQRLSDPGPGLPGGCHCGVSTGGRPVTTAFRIKNPGRTARGATREQTFRCCTVPLEITPWNP